MQLNTGRYLEAYAPDDAGVLRYGPVFHRYRGRAVAAIFFWCW